MIINVYFLERTEHPLTLTTGFSVRYMIKPLPPRPNLDFLRDLAKCLLAEYRSADTSAADRFSASLPSHKRGRISLHDAQTVIAVEYGFPNWQKLVAHVKQARTSGGTPSLTLDPVSDEIPLGEFDPTGHGDIVPPV